MFTFHYLMGPAGLHWFHVTSVFVLCLVYYIGFCIKFLCVLLLYVSWLWVHLSNCSYCLNCPDCIHQTSVCKMRLTLIKHYCAAAALLGYWVISCILLVNLGYQGWTGKRPRGADTRQTRRPGLLLLLNHPSLHLSALCFRWWCLSSRPGLF